MAFETDVTQAAFGDGSKLIITDGGMETWVYFREGIDIPHFAGHTLMENQAGREAVRRWYEKFFAIAESSGVGYQMDTNTWRAGFYWANDLGKTHEELAEINRAAVTEAMETRDRWKDRVSPILVSGTVGPAGDGYAIDRAYSADEAEEIHSPQIQELAKAGVDLITALTINNSNEAVGIVRASVAAGVPVVISFVVETDARLLSGETIEEAVTAVDAATGSAALHYMINCAHPDHFLHVFDRDTDWTRRIGGLRTNASRQSHTELDNSETLDDGDPAEHGKLHRDLLRSLPQLRLVGGCCGTDERHVRQIVDAITG